VVCCFAAVLAACGTSPVRTSSYTVKAGDTLFSIASRYRLDYHELARFNGIGRDYHIYPGQRLKLNLPNHAQQTGKSAARQPAATAPAAFTTTMKFDWPATSVRYTATTRPNGGRGLLIKGNEGEDIRAAQAGRVMYVGSGLLGYGQLLIVRHDERLLTAYGHLQTIIVREGQSITAGQKIATMGNGPDGTPVLYFEIRVDGTPVDPLSLLPQQ